MKIGPPPIPPAYANPTNKKIKTTPKISIPDNGNKLLSLIKIL